MVSDKEEFHLTNSFHCLRRWTPHPFVPLRHWLLYGLSFCMCSKVRRWHCFICSFSFCSRNVSSLLENMINATKTQLICFQLKFNLLLPDGMFSFFGHPLCFSSSLIHLGHLLRFNLDDADDANRISSDMCRIANYLLHLSSAATLQSRRIFSLLTLSPCMVQFPGTWPTSNLKLRLVNVLRKIWKLPRQYRTGILHCIAKAPSIFNHIINLISSTFHKASTSYCILISQCLTASSCLVPLVTIDVISNHSWKAILRMTYFACLWFVSFTSSIWLSVLMTKLTIFSTPSVVTELLISLLLSLHKINLCIYIFKSMATMHDQFW